jgi:hypothetical protein
MLASPATLVMDGAAPKRTSYRPSPLTAANTPSPAGCATNASAVAPSIVDSISVPP